MRMCNMLWENDTGEAAFWAWWIPQDRPGLGLASLLFAH